MSFNSFYNIKIKDDILLKQNCSIEELIGQIQKNLTFVICIVNGKTIRYFLDKDDIPKNITFSHKKNNREYYFINNENNETYCVIGTEYVKLFCSKMIKNKNEGGIVIYDENIKYNFTNCNYPLNIKKIIF